MNIIKIYKRRIFEKLLTSVDLTNISIKLVDKLCTPMPNSVYSYINTANKTGFWRLCNTAIDKKQLISLNEFKNEINNILNSLSPIDAPFNISNMIPFLIVRIRIRQNYIK